MQFTLFTLTSILLAASTTSARPNSCSSPSAPSVSPAPIGITPTVRIQLNGISGEDATQHEVPADGSAFSLNVATDIFSASVVDAEGLRAPACQVFEDLEGLVSASEISFTDNGDTELLLWELWDGEGWKCEMFPPVDVLST